MGLEGTVSKNVNSPYRSGTTLHCLKAKAFGEGEFHIIGIAREPKEPPVAVLAHGELDALRYAGNAFIALPYEDRDALWAAADYLEVSKPAVRHTGKQKAQWLKPELIARVRFLRGEGKLRHAT
jgi:ATP-dependent DNA ligase